MGTLQTSPKPNNIKMKKVAIIKGLILLTLTNGITGCLQQPQTHQSTPNSVSVNVEHLLEQGNSKFDNGDYKSAIAAYDQAIKLNPNSAAAYNYRGFTRSSLGDKQPTITNYAQAINDYNQAIKLKPDFATAYNNRGSLHFDRGDTQAAIADYDQAIKFKPDFILAYLNRGNAHAKLGDPQSAIADLTKVSEMLQQKKINEPLRQQTLKQIQKLQSQPKS
jgi:tetratricopeptide (TPR) repeat protein